MKKLTLLIFLLLISNFIQAEEIKLSCDIKFVSRNIPSGETNEFTKKLIYEITERQDGTIFLLSHSYGFAPSVTTVKTAGNISIDNYSNESKWHIRNVFNSKLNSFSDNEVIIDRNTGLIHISKTFTTKLGLLETSGDGYCEKVNLTKKNF
jgi:hypothetical protein